MPSARLRTSLKCAILLLRAFEALTTRKGKGYPMLPNANVDLLLKKFANNPLGFVCWEPTKPTSTTKRFYLHSGNDGISSMYKSWSKNKLITPQKMKFEEDEFFIKRAIAAFVMGLYDRNAANFRSYIKLDDPDRFIENVEMIASDIKEALILAHCEWLVKNPHLGTISRWCQMNKDGFIFHHRELQEKIVEQFSQG